MIVACGEWGLRELGMEEHFRFCRKLGFHFLEIGIGGQEAGRLKAGMNDKEVSAFLQLRDKYGIETPFCMLENDFTLPDEGEHRRQLHDTLESLHLAKKLGARIVRLFAGFTPADELNEAIWKRLLGALKDCDEVCRGLDLKISLETHGKVTESHGVFYHVQTVSTDRTCLRRLCEEMPENIGFCYDPGNMRAVDPEDDRYALDLIDDRINYCHLKDWRPKADGWYPGAPGDDELDYASLLPKISYEGPYAIEYEPTEDVEDGFRRGLEYLRRIGESIESR